MKKKILSSLLFAALVGGAVSTFTACKDYDDDINSLQTKVDQLEALKAVKADVDAEITSLKSQLEQANSKIDKNVSDIAALETKIAALETAKTKLQEAIDKKADKTWVEANYATISYVDGLYANIIAAGGEKLGDKMKGLLENEYEALKAGAWTNLKLQLEALEKAASMEPDAEGKYAPIVQAIKDLQAITKDYDVSKYGTLKELAEKMNTLSTDLTKIDAKINILTVLCGQQLRSLVFQPQAYYWGVEATSLFTLDGKKWNTKATAWDKFETGDQTYKSTVDYGYKTYSRYPNADFFKVLDFVATYHMNPSTAVVDKEKGHTVTVVSDDKDFITTRAAAAGLKVKDFDPKNGDLNVILDVSDKGAIKSAADGKITVFAVQAHMGDTTVTSDYATIVKKNISDVKIYHKVAKRTITEGLTTDPLTGKPMAPAVVCHTAANNGKVMDQSVPGYSDTGIPSWNEEVSEGTAANNTRSVEYLPGYSRTLGPVLGTVKQAYDYYPQDTVCYNTPNFDLKELVCIRIWDGESPKEVDPAELGLHYEFELTALYVNGKNMVGNEQDAETGAAHTSESAHACISGDLFRPQMAVKASDSKNGVQAPWNSAQGEQTIGRTPVVRVSLKDDAGNVYDYGYIRLLITPEVKAPAKPVEVVYVGDAWNYNYECTAPGYSWFNTWVQVEYDLYKKVGMTRDQFVANYMNNTIGTDGPVSYNAQEFKQYVWDDVKKEYVELEYSKYVGQVGFIPGDDEGGEETTTLTWDLVKGNGTTSAYTQFVTNKKTQTVVKYESLDKTVGPDIYVIIKAGAINVATAPVATISWDALKNPSYWYANNSNVSATNGGTPIADAIEMHNNVLTPEDGYTDAKLFRQTIAATMIGNTISSSIITGWTGEDKANVFKNNTKVSDLVFSAKNNDKKYKGASGIEYTVKVTNGGKKLTAYKPNDITGEVIAYITTGAVNDQKIIYGTGEGSEEDYINYGKSTYAKDLLNYVAHNALADDVVRAIVGVKLTNKCGLEVVHNDATIDVRFLRPINVANNNKEIEDASTGSAQVINMLDLVDFKDWREVWKKESYPAFYGIKSITVDGVTNGQSISNNINVTTNQTGKFEPLKNVNEKIDFVYSNTPANVYGTLTYKNFSSTVDQFQVKIPVTVEYFWGKISTTVTVNVKRTAGGNAPAK